MFNAQQEVKDTAPVSFKLRWHRRVAARQTRDRLTVHFHECPQVTPLGCSMGTGNAKSLARGFVEQAKSRGGSGTHTRVNRVPGLRSLTSRCTFRSAIRCQPNDPHCARSCS